MKLAFILSSGRSGSTLLASMLNMHREIHVPVELIGLYAPLPARLPYFGDLSRRRNRLLLGQALQYIGQLREFAESFDPEGFADRLGETGGSLADVVRCFYRTLLPDGKSVLVDKTPNSSIHHDRMIELFPDARFIHLVRDGRDVALSSIRSRTGLNHRNLYELAGLWSRNNLRLQEFGRRHPASYRLVRYEDLVREPARELAAVCELLDEEYGDELLRFSSGDFARKNAEKLGHHGNLERGVLSDNVEKWRTDLPAADVALYDRFAGEGLRAFGYDCDVEARAGPLRVFGPWLATQGRRLGRTIRDARTEATMRAAVLAKRVRARG